MYNNYFLIKFGLLLQLLFMSYLGVFRLDMVRWTEGSVQELSLLT